MQRAVNGLSKYFGLHTASAMGAAIGGQEVSEGSEDLAAVQGRPASGSGPVQDEVLARIIELFIETSEGALTTQSFVGQIAETMGEATEETKNRVRQLIICYGTNNSNFRQVQGVAGDQPVVTVNQLLRNAEGQGVAINGYQDAEPTKDKPGLSVILSNSKRVSQSNRHVNAVSIFMNGIPSLEISKAVPYLNIEFLFARPPVNTSTNRLQTPSTLKFLRGAEVVPGGSEESTSAYRTLALGSVTTQETSQGRERVNEVYSVAGMEMFTTPQTLVNADEVDQEENRSNPVLDKFRPFMSIKDFEVSIVGTTGLANYKTARLSLILHDRSRLADVADFIRPDLYGRTELVIEYGWSHPDGERAARDNPYGDLINGMRCKEKYGVRNSSYTFDDAGQVAITLELSMRGGVDTSTEIISSNEESVGNAILEIERLQSTVTELRQRLFSTQGTRTREVRGIQFLNAAQDAMAHAVLSSDLRGEIRNLQAALTETDNPDTRALRTALDELFGTEAELESGVTTGTPRRTSSTRAAGQVGALRRSVLDSISEKVGRMNGAGTDPFLIQNYPDLTSNGAGRSRQVQEQTAGAAGRERTAYQTNFQTSVAVGQKVSLATLLLHFVGEPLANTRKFDDIQLIFYPFNASAGFAANLNVGNFEVDLAFFAQEFARIRLANIGRSANMNLREFMNFLGQIVIDDPAARSYGLWDEQGAFYREVYDAAGMTRSTESIDEAPGLQQRTERRLRGVTPDGSFRMPQIEFYLECLPEKLAMTDGADDSGSSAKSILRLHVYDRHSSAYETLGALLASSRDGQLEAVGRIPGGQSGNTAVSANTAADHSAFVEAAERYGLVERINPDKAGSTPGADPPPVMYRITGGPRKLKEFLYNTCPYIIYGAGGSLVKVANVSSMQNPELSTVNMLRSFRRSELQPNGELPGGLPMRVIPTELTMQTMGCPLIVYTQQFFIDFQTGTSVDNIYGVTGITHKITEGEFSTDIRFTPVDAYGRYESFYSRIQMAQEVLEDISRRQAEAQEAVVPGSAGGGPATGAGAGARRNGGGDRST